MTWSQRGWTVFCNEDVAETIAALPLATRTAIIEFLVDLARTSGAAIDMGIPPQGSPVDQSGIQFGVTMAKPPTIVEYLVISDIREFRVTSLVPLLPE
jgi:hypothetical protein